MINQAITSASLEPYDNDNVRLTISYSYGADEVIDIRKNSVFVTSSGDYVNISWNNYGSNPKFEYRIISYDLFTYPTGTTADSVKVSVQQIVLPIRLYYPQFMFM